MIFSRRSGQERPPERRRPTAVRQRPDDARTGQAFSYHAVRSQGDFNVGRVARAEQPARKQPRVVQRVILDHKRAALISVGLLIAALYNLQLAPVPEVVALTTSADAPFLRETSVYQKAAETVLRESAANRNKLTINGPAVASRLRTDFPELRDVSVSLPLIGSTPTVYIQPSSPAAVITGSGGVFVIDENGRALVAARSPGEAANYKVPLVVDQSRLPLSVGEPAIPRSAALFIRDVAAQMQAQNYKVSRIVLPANDSLLSVYFEGQPYFAKFDLRDERSDAARLQAGSLRAVLDELARQGTKPAAYVDVRVPGRVYYR